MALAPGTRLGPYEITGQIGAGGMGEVYRARDTKLNRDVALKVLPDLFARDADRLGRFRREAQVLASLNHPHIGHIYGFEETAAPHMCALALEFVEGEDLSQRIARGAIPLDEAVPLAKQIAEALESAHEQGIVHRDLKPANVKVRHDGTIKVLDFGLAKALVTDATSTSAEALNSPTLTAHGTQMGVILGTAAYMSPEQAKGRAVDRRGDVWAFGAVLYEMLTGQRAFKGDDISDTMAAVLRQDVDWSALPVSTPASIRWLLARCLERDSKRRLRDIGEARIVLEDPTAAELKWEVAPSVAQFTATTRPFWLRALPIVITVVATAAVATAIAWRVWSQAVPPPAVTRFPYLLPDGHVFAGTARNTLAISPDGAHLAYVAIPSELYIRSMSDMEVRPIRGTKSLRAVASPVFSPDGQSVAFHALLDNTLKRVSIAGGAPVTICPADNPTGISWGRDGIVFGQGAKGVMRVSADGGTPEQVVTLERDEYVQGPQMLPDGEHLLFSVASGSLSNRWDTARLMTHSLRSGERKVLITGASDGRYVPTGHLIYLVSGTMFAVPFDLERLEVKGGAVPVVEGVRRASQDQSGAADFAFSDSGTLVYQPGPAAVIGGQVQLVVADRKGVVTPLNVAAGAYETPRVSPDGIRVAVSAADQNGSTIWIYSLAGTGAAQRLTSGGNSRYPIWTSDGKRIAFQSDRDGDAAIFWQPADGSGSAERLTKPEPNTSHTPESWAADGNSLLFSVTKGLDVSLWVLSLRDRKTTPFGNVRSSTPPDAAFSPDGRWVAYAMTEQGATRMYVEPFPATGSRYQLVSQPSDSAHHPVWTRDGKELIYTPRPGALEAVSVTTTPALAFGTPVAWARPFETGPPSRRRPFDVTPGGTLVGVVAPGPSDTPGPRLSPRIHVVLNWFEELKRLVPVK